MSWFRTSFKTGSRDASAVSGMLVNTHEELSQLRPRCKRLLAVELDTLSLLDRMCPVLFDDGSAGLFVICGTDHDDQVAAVLDLLMRKKFKLQERPVYAVSRPVLLSLIKPLRLNDERALSSGLRGQDRRPALIRIFDEIIEWAFDAGASDVHFNVRTSDSQSLIRYTIDGHYVEGTKFSQYPTLFMLEMLSLVWMEIKGGNGAVFDPTIEQQGRLERTAKGIQLTLRWASLATDHGPSVCLRLLRSDPTALAPTLMQLGYLPSQVDTFERAALIEGGAVVLSGSVGSGKSTTIATLMKNIPVNRKIITIEDPAEFVIANALQNTLTRSLDGSDRQVFDSKLTTIKRSAMNDLLIGEIRDAAGGRAFMDLAASGASLYTTVHARSCLLICERLSSSLIGVSRDFLASPGVLKLLVHQMLLPALCRTCSIRFCDVPAQANWLCAKGHARPYQWFVRWIKALTSAYQLNVEALRFRNVKGCEVCRAKKIESLFGLESRTVVAEMIEPTCESDFLDALNDPNRSTLKYWFDTRSRATLTNDNMFGKSIFECAIFKISIGQIDPRSVETRFGPFQLSL